MIISKDDCQSMSVKLAFLGTGTCNSTGKNPSSLALSNGHEVVLVDTGGGSYQQLSRLGDDAFHYKKISAIYITHFHIDHISGLPDLLWGEMWDHAGRREEPLTIVGPHGLKNFFNDRVMGFMGDYPLPFEVKLIELGDRESAEGSFFKATSYHLEHGEFSTGYLFDLGAAKLAVTGDTGYCENLITLLKESNVAVMEWGVSDFTKYPGHISSSDIVKLVKIDALPEKVYIVHMYPVPGETMAVQKAKCRELLGDKSVAFAFPDDLDIITLT